jgi:hypothetical protein
MMLCLIPLYSYSTALHSFIVFKYFFPVVLSLYPVYEADVLEIFVKTLLLYIAAAHLYGSTLCK